MMSNLDASGASNRQVRQKQARDDWHRLCETIEQAQGDELAKTSRQRFAFIRTYQVYGSRYKGLVTKLKHAADSGDFGFFQERGVPSDVLDWRLAEQLLRDWNDIVTEKKRRLAEIYQLQYGEPLEEAVRTDEDAFQLSSAQPLHETDALLLLSGRGKPSGVDAELESLRGELAQLRLEFEGLSKYVRQEIASLSARVAEKK
jgi:hypothetical protein